MLGTNFDAAMRLVARTIPAASILIFGLSGSPVAAEPQLAVHITPAKSRMQITMDGRQLAVLPVKPHQYRALTARQDRRMSRRIPRWHDGCGGYAGYYGHGGYGYYSGWHGYRPGYGYHRPSAYSKLELKTGKELELVALPGDIDPLTTASINDDSGNGVSGQPLIDRWRGPSPVQALTGSAVDIVISRRPEIEMIAEFQHGLNRLGHDAGTEDGMTGPRTRAAVERFQQANGLAVDGRIGPATVNALHAALGPKAPHPAIMTIRRDEEIVERFDIALGQPGSKLGNHILLRDRQAIQLAAGWRMAKLSEGFGSSSGALFGLDDGQPAGVQAGIALERLRLNPEQAATVRRLVGAGSTLVITDHAIESGGMQMQLAAK